MGAIVIDVRVVPSLLVASIIPFPCPRLTCIDHHYVSLYDQIHAHYLSLRLRLAFHPSKSVTVPC